MRIYALIYGPYDGTILKIQQGTDRIALQMGHSLPGDKTVEIEDGEIIGFTICPTYEAIYDEFGDGQHSGLTEEDLEKYGGYPLFFNTKESGVRKNEQTN